MRLTLISLLLPLLVSCGGGGGGDSDPLPENSPPSASNVEITDDNGGEAEVGDTLTGSYTYQDAEGDAEGETRFRWLRNGTPINGATNPEYQVVPSDSGNTIAFEVTPVAVTGTNTGARATSDTVNVVNNNANLQALRLSSGELDQIFQPSLTSYTSTQGFLASSIRLIITAQDSQADIEVNGISTDSGQPSQEIPIEIGSTTIVVTVTATDGVTRKQYTLDVLREDVSDFAQEAYVKASNTGPNDAFGQSLAVFGDILAVGATGEDSGATGIGGNQNDSSALGGGAVYVFLRSDGIWRQEAYIKSPSTVSSGSFGSELSLSGNTLIVGAPQEGPEGQGNVHVYVRQDGVWALETTIRPSQDGDSVGRALALSGDTLAIGSAFEDSSATGINGNDSDNSVENSGAVYVYKRENNNWVKQAYIKASNPDFDDRFGHDVALDGDTLVVSARWESSSARGVGGNQNDNSASASGAVYVFSRVNSNWSQQAYLKAFNSEADDQFGWGVALSGDTLAVSAIGEDSSSTNPGDNFGFDSGAVYIFSLEGGRWRQTAYLKASESLNFIPYGYSVDLEGDFLAVGQLGARGFEGRIFLYSRAGESWEERKAVVGSNVEASDDFGRTLSIGGDTLAVGAPHEDSSARGVNGEQGNSTSFFSENSGAVYLFQ